MVLLPALVGSGAQLAMLVLLVILLAFDGILYIECGAIVTYFTVCYALISFISGSVSGGLYSRNDACGHNGCLKVIVGVVDTLGYTFMSSLSNSIRFEVVENHDHLHGILGAKETNHWGLKFH